MSTQEQQPSSSRQNSNNPAPIDKVIFQKVLRPPPGLPDVLFLGYLVEYLEQHFTLPTESLPMVYETQYKSDDDDNSDESDSPEDGTSSSTTSSANRCLLAWDSPLSPSSEATRMELEVVGVYTNQESNDDNGDAGDIKSKNNSNDSTALTTVPNVAMGGVRKANNGNGSSSSNPATIPPMMQNLFQDSERKILKALERGLDDFVAGKVQFDVEEKRRVELLAAEETAENTTKGIIDAEIVESTNEKNGASSVGTSERTSPDDVVFDAYATADVETEFGNTASPPKPKRVSADPKAKARAIATMEAKANKGSKLKGSNNEKTKPAEATVDFAVEAAKKIVQKRKKVKVKRKRVTDGDTTEDFAVVAARKLAETRKGSQKKSSTTIKASEDVTTSSDNAANEAKPKSKRKPVKGGPYVTKAPSIEMPPGNEDWDPISVLKGTRKYQTVLSTPENRPKDASKKDKKRRNWKELAAKMQSKTFTEEFRTESTPNPVRVVQAEKKTDKSNDFKDDDGGDVEPPSDSMQVPPGAESIAKQDAEISDAANNALDEIAALGQDMSAEDILRDVLKFDEEQKKEESTGSGFVSGAFEKAKELLNNRNQQLQSKNKGVGFKEVENRPLTEEEELKAMFAAGQQFAEGRITQRLRKTENSPGSIQKQKTGTTEEDVDELIAQEKSISSYARKLDDELAELELCINQSPDEEFDPPGENPIFDIMSGPEVYNPNVEPDTINYPGAPLGAKEIRLPKELKEAVKQADFAASVLSNLETVEEKDENGEKHVRYYAGKNEVSEEQVRNLKRVVQQGSRVGIIEDPLNLMAERSRLQLILDELWNQPAERFQEVASSFKDLLLSNNFVPLIQERLHAMAARDLEALRQDDESLKANHEREREILGELVVYTQCLLKEARALGAELEAQQLEVVRSICKVAMDPSHVTEEDTALALSDAVRDMRPMLDDVFVAYLKYAVAEEEAKLARQGVVDDPDHNQWLFVLKIVQQGVYAEIAKGINRYIEHIWYVLRMDTPRQRRLLLEELINDMPTMDVRPFVQVVDNIVGSLGDGVKGDFDGVVPLGEMTNKLLQLQQDVKTVLPPERITEMSKDADEWAALQKKRLMEQRKVGEQRLKAARNTESRQDEIDDLLTLGESERFD
ncbi:MAG: hypothetical protein SGILL_002963 [Bacillariaceae sp.]